MFGRLLAGLAKAHRRWPGGIYALWYPIKDRQAVDDFRTALGRAGIPKILDIAFEVEPETPGDRRFTGSGMIVVNPPFTLEGELGILLPALQEALAEPGAPPARLRWLARENHTA